MFLYNALCSFYYVLFYVTFPCFLLHPCRDPSTVATIFNLSQSCFNLLSCFKSTVFCSNLWTCALIRIIHLLFSSLRMTWIFLLFREHPCHIFPIYLCLNKGECETKRKTNLKALSWVESDIYIYIYIWVHIRLYTEFHTPTNALLHIIKY